MVLTNFIFRYFYLFLPGLILNIVGIWIEEGLVVGLSVWFADLLLSVISQLRVRKASLEVSDNEDFNEFMDAAFDPDNPKNLDDVLQEKMRRQEAEHQDNQDILQRLVVYRTLKESIREGMTLDEMIDAFEEMCKISVGEPDDLLFETGIYSFDEDKEFTFSLVRQFKFLDDDEYVQLRLNVSYLPHPKTRLLYKVKWGTPEDGNFFDMVRKSRPYRTVIKMPIQKVSVSVEET